MLVSFESIPRNSKAEVKSKFEALLVSIYFIAKRTLHNEKTAAKRRSILFIFATTSVFKGCTT